MASEFRAEHVLRATLRLLAQRALAIIALGLIAAAGPAALVAISETPFRAFAAVAPLTLVLSLLTGSLVAASVLTDASRGTASTSPVPKTGVRLALGAGTLTVVFVVLATPLLVVPGIVLGLTISVAIPVAFVERKGPLAALRRSAQLSVGFRASLFLVFLIIALAFFALPTALTLVALSVSPTVASLVILICGALGLAVGSTAAAVAYQQLLEAHGAAPKTSS